MTTPAALKAVATGQQTPTEAKNPHKLFSDQLERTKPQLMRLMGGSASNVEKLCGVIERAVMDNPELLETDRRSLVGACMKAAQDGLMPDGREAVLNIYNTNVARRNEPAKWVKMAQYLPMVAGYVKGLYEHEDVASVDAAAVFQNDKFIFRRGDDPKLEHEPTMDDDAGPVVAAYLVVKLKNGQIKREVMPRRDIEKVRQASKSPDGVNSPWTKWYDQQAIKSVIKRGAKQLPRANKFDQIDQSDNEALGFAATPENVASAFMVNASAPALEHNPSETLEMPIGGQQSEMVDAAHGDAGEGSQESQAQQQAPQPSAAPKVSLAQLKKRMEGAPDSDVADLILDEGRGALSPADYADLLKVHTAKFPN